MKEFSEKEQEALLKTLKKHKKHLMAFKGVHYLDVGYKFEKGKRTDKLVIRVHVYEKKPESELDPSQVLPRDIEGVPIDVIQSRPVPEQEAYRDRDSRFNPIVGGVQVRNTRHGFSGTLGAIVFDVASLAPMGLSNHHVFVGGTGQAGDNIVQPATLGAANIIGTLTRWDQNLDCAVCTLNNSRIISRRILDYPEGATGARQPFVGMRVTKSGRTTGTTFGVVDGVSFDEFTIIPDPFRPSPTGEISAGGDSGSVWLEFGRGYAVGLHWGGEISPDPADERAWAKRMINVVRALNIVIEPADGAIGVISKETRRIDVFARGQERALLHKWWDGMWRPRVGDTHSWESLGPSAPLPPLASGPAAASWAPDRIDLFWRGENTALWHRWWDGAGWSGCESLGGILTSDPAAVS